MPRWRKFKKFEKLSTLSSLYSSSFSNSLFSANLAELSTERWLTFFQRRILQKSRHANTARKMLKPSREKPLCCMVSRLKSSLGRPSVVHPTDRLMNVNRGPPVIGTRVSRVGVEDTAMIYNRVGERDFRQVASATFTMTRENEQLEAWNYVAAPRLRKKKRTGPEETRSGAVIKQ